MRRLDAQTILPPDVVGPDYAPHAYGIGIVHIGLGAFHKAHQAVYSDTALAREGGDWRIAAISLRSTGPSAELAPQDARYTMLERYPDRARARVIGAIAQALHLGSDAARIRDLLAAPSTRVVTITVTEKGYGLDRNSGGVDPDHAAMAHDLLNPGGPVGVIGLLVAALALRRSAGTAPFTILSCDNLAENGRMLKGLLLDFATRACPDLGGFIETDVATPSCMVDRITPASTETTRRAAAALIGAVDHAAVETEPFSQWVIEDCFPNGRPAWDAAGATLTADVQPFEQMKLTMLNGAHSMLAYVGFHAGHRHVRDAMADPSIARLVARHLDAAAATLMPPPGFCLASYARDLMARFSNPAIAHQTLQIATDGTQKLPQRIFAPALEAQRRGQSLAPFAFATAAWMRHASGRIRDRAFEVDDARGTDIASALRGATSAAEIAASLRSLPGFVPDALLADPVWTSAVVSSLSVMLDQGMHAAIEDAVRAI